MYTVRKGQYVYGYYIYIHVPTEITEFLPPLTAESRAFAPRHLEKVSPRHRKHQALCRRLVASAGVGWRRCEWLDVTGCDWKCVNLACRSDMYIYICVYIYVYIYIYTLVMYTLDV